MTRSLAMVSAAFVLVACDTPYLHVIVEGSDPVLTIAPVDVRVAVYGADDLVEFEYTTSMDSDARGAVPATDFTLELAAPAQLRVSLDTTATSWFADARVLGEGTLHLPLFAGERQVASASLGPSDQDTSVLFGAGIVIAWIDGGGVQIRVEKEPDRLIARSEVVAADSMARVVRLASRPNPLGYGPDLYAVTWIGRDGMVRTRTTTATAVYPVRDLGALADDVVTGAAFKGAPMGAAIAVASRTGSNLGLRILDESGLPAAGPLGLGMGIASGVSTVVGITVTRDAIVVAWRDGTGSRLGRFGFDGAPGGVVTLDADVLAVALTGDGSRVLTLQRRGLEVYQVSYFLDLNPTGVEASLGRTIAGSRVSLSACVAAWPEVRPDGSGRTDLRFAALDADGRAIGDPHLLNAETAGDHLAPTAVCASPTRAYATFFGRGSPTDATGRLRIRRIPTY